MKEVLADIQSGKFTKQWMDECKNGQKNFLKTREKLVLKQEDIEELIDAATLAPFYTSKESFGVKKRRRVSNN